MEQVASVAAKATTREEMARAAEQESARLMVAESAFAETLDPAVLPLPTDDLIQVTICGLSGLAFEEIEDRIDPRLRTDPARWKARREAETIRSGLVAVDRIEGATSSRLPAGYDVEALATDFGRTWPDARREIAARICTLSDLGPSAGSSSAPSSGEPTATTGG